MSDKGVYRVKREQQHTGSLTEIDWNGINSITNFKSPWQQAAANTVFQAFHDNQFLYFRFGVTEQNILVYQNRNVEQEVVQSERVEIFFRQNDRLNPYYCLEMDASGRVFDYKATHYRNFEPDWRWPQGHLTVLAQTTQDGYTVLGMISLESLRQLGLLADDKLQAGLYRGRCTELKDGQAEFHWISWVDPKTEDPDFHVPSSFGELLLSQ